MIRVKPGINDLKTVYPEIAKEWDYQKNAPLKPNEVSYASGKKRWWICPQGHSYQATIDHRTKMHSGCPICAGKIIQSGFNDLKTLRPELADQWHPTKNGELSPNDVAPFSNRIAWWICPQGHSYEARIADRSRHNSGCPICGFQNRTSKPEQAVYYYIKKYYPDAINSFKTEWLGKKELDIYIPSRKAAIEFDGKGWHQDVERDIEKSKLLTQHGITLYRIREEGCPQIDDESVIITVPTNSMQIGRNALEEGIRFLIEALDNEITPDVCIVRDYNNIMHVFSDRKVNRSLEIEFPDIAKEWHPTKNGDMKPSSFTSGSAERVWWKCFTCGYEWEMAISHRTRLGGSCPRCRGRNLVTGSNDLQTLRPDIAKEWDMAKNTKLFPSQVTTGNGSKVWWMCPKGHSYEAIIKDRVKKKLGCPYCSGKRAYPGENDLLTLNPVLAEEWHLGKNEITPNMVRPGSGKKVWWICRKCGHEWQARIYDRNMKKSGCPICARNKRARQ